MLSSSKSCCQCLQNRSEPTAPVAPSTASGWTVAAASPGVSLLLSLSPPNPARLLPTCSQREAVNMCQLMFRPCLNPPVGHLTQGKSKSPRRGPRAIWSHVLVSNVTSLCSSHTGLLAALSAPGTPHFRAFAPAAPPAGNALPPEVFTEHPYSIQGSGLQANSSKAF